MYNKLCTQSGAFAEYVIECLYSCAHSINSKLGAKPTNWHTNCHFCHPGQCLLLVNCCEVLDL